MYNLFEIQPLTAVIFPLLLLISESIVLLFAVEASTVTNVAVTSDVGWDLTGCGLGGCDPRLTRVRRSNFNRCFTGQCVEFAYV